MTNILKDRQEIAKAINFAKYPVLELDTANEIVLGGMVAGYNGSKVRVKWQYQGETLYLHCELKYFKDSKKLTVSSGGCTLAARFSYKDLMEMVEYSNTPIIDKNMEVVLVIHNSKIGVAYPPVIMKFSDYKNINCQTVLEFEEDLPYII